jgi:GNAT superfamily N-acetyltransferase
MTTDAPATPETYETRRARPVELPQLAALRWRWVQAAGDEDLTPDAGYVADALRWYRDHEGSHIPFVAVTEDGQVAGMAWLAVTDRVPAPGRLDRRSGDLQSCYVLPSHRGRGVARAIVRTLLAHAWDMGLEHVTVHASPRSVPMYERAGFRQVDELLWLAAP